MPPREQPQEQVLEVALGLVPELQLQSDLATTQRALAHERMMQQVHQ